MSSGLVVVRLEAHDNLCATLHEPKVVIPVRIWWDIPVAFPMYPDSVDLVPNKFQAESKNFICRDARSSCSVHPLVNYRLSGMRLFRPGPLRRRERYSRLWTARTTGTWS